MIEVSTPLGERWTLASDEGVLKDSASPASVRLLLIGDALYLLHGADRDLLVPDSGDRERLWTSRVWPGAVLVDGEIVGAWRRDSHRVSIDLWGSLGPGRREAVADEASGLPLPGLADSVTVTWDRG